LLHGLVLLGPQIVYRRCRAETHRKQRPENKYSRSQAHHGKFEPVPVDPRQGALDGVRTAYLREAAAVNGCPYLAVAWVFGVVVATFMCVADRLAQYQFHYAASRAASNANGDMHLSACMMRYTQVFLMADAV
jgi:hypothetical protein